MRKLAIALGVAAAVLFAGGVAWKADAMTWRSGTSISRLRQRTIRRSRRPLVMDGAGTAHRDSPGVVARGGAGAGLAKFMRHERPLGPPTLLEAASRGGLLLCEGVGTSAVLPCHGARNFNTLRFTARVRITETRAAGKTEAGMESVRRRLRHDELAFSSVCLRARSGLAQAARGGDGLLGRRSRGAARAIPRPYERRSEHRAVS